MWCDNKITAYVVLGIGNWLGGVTKGVTGFGSAILNLCCWIAFTIAGISSGKLQQAVVCEAVASTVVAPGLLYVTRAHGTADLRVVAAIALFVALSSPLGAAILAQLDAKRVELVMATVLLAIIVTEQLSKLLSKLLFKRTAATSSPTDSSNTTRLLNSACFSTSEAAPGWDTNFYNLLGYNNHSNGYFPKQPDLNGQIAAAACAAVELPAPSDCMVCLGSTLEPGSTANGTLNNADTCLKAPHSNRNSVSLSDISGGMCGDVHIPVLVPVGAAWTAPGANQWPPSGHSGMTRTAADSPVVVPPAVHPSNPTAPHPAVALQFVSSTATDPFASDPSVGCVPVQSVLCSNHANCTLADAAQQPPLAAAVTGTAADPSAADPHAADPHAAEPSVLAPSGLARHQPFGAAAAAADLCDIDGHCLQHNVCQANHSLNSGPIQTVSGSWATMQHKHGDVLTSVHSGLLRPLLVDLDRSDSDVAAGCLVDLQMLIHHHHHSSSSSSSGSDSSCSTSSSGRHYSLHWQQHSSCCGGWRAWVKVLGIGCIAGTLSGTMEGLTGMNGPPIMFMYRRLNTPKATVRGNNAFLNLLQMRLIPYWYMGLITPQDLQLYAVACAAALVGVLIGDMLSYGMNQQVFQQVLGALMALCCGLMFASGLGLVA